MALTRLLNIAYPLTISGLVGTVGYVVIDPAGNTLVARTTAGITEAPGLPGLYLATVAIDPAWSGLIVWDDGSGANPVTIPFEATSASSVTGPDPTNVLLFINDEGGVLTDLDFPPVLRDTDNTYGVKRTDTGNVIVASGAASMTRLSTGVYSYDPGLAYVDVPLTYAVEYTSGGVTLHADGLFRAAMSAAGHWATISDMVLELLGQTNYNVNADGENNGLQADIDANGEDSLDGSDVETNLLLREAGIPIPYVPINNDIRATIRYGARKIATGLLLNKRAYQRDPSKTPTAGDALITKGTDIITRLAKTGDLTVTTEDDAYTVAAPVAAGATVDPNGCPLPATVCGWPPYRYYSRVD